MRTVLVTGSDTGVGKTHVVATLARLLSAEGARVQIVKVVETGRSNGDEGDAAVAQRLSGGDVAFFTIASFSAALAPAAAASAAGKELSLEMLIAAVDVLPDCDWRILEGAGGIATPVDASCRDWADLAAAVGADAVVIVVADRLGAINQARLAYARAAEQRLHAGVWLNAVGSVDPEVAISNRAGLRSAGLPIWAEQAHGVLSPQQPDALRARLMEPANGGGPSTAGAARVAARCATVLETRARQGLRRTLRVAGHGNAVLNLADNDYLALANDMDVIRAVIAGVAAHGTSAAASPLITGWREVHEELVRRLCDWHRFPFGLLWSSGYAANSAVLGGLPTRGDLVLADRLIHHSMIAGLLRSGAVLKRYEHLRLDRLEELLERAMPSGRQVFVATESVFSMDGDYPDLAGMAELKRCYGFCWIVDEAHALGWYGAEGAGLVRAAGVEENVDVLVGTLGKTLASGGAYTLFRDEVLRDYLVNTAGEFIYSTALSPLNVVAATSSVERVRALATGQPEWHAMSREFRACLQQEDWQVSPGDSPIVPVRLNDASAALSLADALRSAGVLVGAVRPPTVPAGTSRLRFSLKRTFGRNDAERILRVMREWRAAR